MTKNYNTYVPSKDQREIITYHHPKPTEKEIQQEKRFQKYDAFLDNLQYNVIPSLILAPFKIIGKLAKTIDNFFDMRVQEDGQIPQEVWDKLYGKK